MASWKADRRLYLSEDGLIVDEAAPGRKTLLAAQGAEVPEDVCRRYGLGHFAEPEPTISEDPPEEEPSHRHYWREDETCRCGAVKE